MRLESEAEHKDSLVLGSGLRSDNRERTDTKEGAEQRSFDPSEGTLMFCFRQVVKE